MAPRRRGVELRVSTTCSTAAPADTGRFSCSAKNEAEIADARTAAEQVDATDFASRSFAADGLQCAAKLADQRAEPLGDHFTHALGGVGRSAGTSAEEATRASSCLPPSAASQSREYAFGDGFRYLATAVSNHADMGDALRAASADERSLVPDIDQQSAGRRFVDVDHRELAARDFPGRKLRLRGVFR